VASESAPLHEADGDLLRRLPALRTAATIALGALLVLLPTDSRFAESDTIVPRLILYGVHATLTVAILVVSFLPFGRRHTDALTLAFVGAISANVLLYFFVSPGQPGLIASALACLLIGTSVLGAWSSRRTFLVSALILVGYLIVGETAVPQELTRPELIYGINALLLGAAVAVVCAEVLGAVRGRLEERQRELSELSARLMSLQEEERRRLARELHDEVGQSLTALNSYLWLADRALPTDLAAAREHGREARRLTSKTLATIRELSQLLRPSVLDDLGLGPSLETLVEAFERRHAIPVVLDVTTLPARMPEHTETAIYRIVQEALTNVERHARATQAWVRAGVEGQQIVVEIADDGIGFPPPGAGRRGLGLIGMHERARALGGVIRLHRGERTRVRLELPRPAAPGADPQRPEA
jgi:signal transduction histidine kinase